MTTTDRSSDSFWSNLTGFGQLVAQTTTTTTTTMQSNASGVGANFVMMRLPTNRHMVSVGNKPINKPATAPVSQWPTILKTVPKVPVNKCRLETFIPALAATTAATTAAAAAAPAAAVVMAGTKRKRPSPEITIRQLTTKRVRIMHVGSQVLVVESDLLESLNLPKSTVEQIVRLIPLVHRPSVTITENESIRGLTVYGVIKLFKHINGEHKEKDWLLTELAKLSNAKVEDLDAAAILLSMRTNA
jgi:hypothetical protein